MAGVKQNFKLTPYRVIAEELGITPKMAQMACYSGLKKMAEEFEARGIDYQEAFFD